MELTPENITDQIKQLLPTNAHFEDQDGSLVLGNPILWLKAKIREYGEQQRKIGLSDPAKVIGKEYRITPIRVDGCKVCEYSTGPMEFCYHNCRSGSHFKRKKD